MYRRRMDMLLAVGVVLLTARVVWAAGPQLYHLPGFYEPFAAISHLVGFVLFAWLGWRLLRRGHRHCLQQGHHMTGRMFVLGLYAFSCVLLMSMSAVFHMVERNGPAHVVMERLDHSAIFILIAGTITPIQALMFRGARRWWPLGLLWATTATAVTLKVVFFDAMPEWLGLTFYLALGWIGGVPIIGFIRRYGWHYVKPLLVGGAFYTLGAIMDLLDDLVLIPRVVHAHEAFHVVVIIGAFCHWLFIYDIAGSDEAWKQA